MLINFDNIEEKINQNFKGGEKYVAARVFQDDKIKIQKVTLVPGASVGYHKHETNSEVIYILKGVGTFNTDGVIEKVHAGEATYCAKGHCHSFTNETDEIVEGYAVIPEQ